MTPINKSWLINADKNIIHVLAKYFLDTIEWMDGEINGKWMDWRINAQMDRQMDWETDLTVPVWTLYSFTIRPLEMFTIWTSPVELPA